MRILRTCLMSGSRVLSTERVLICERSNSGRPAAAMAGADATARVRAHTGGAPPLAAAVTWPRARPTPDGPAARRKHDCVFSLHVLMRAYKTTALRVSLCFDYERMLHTHKKVSKHASFLLIFE